MGDNQTADQLAKLLSRNSASEVICGEQSLARPEPVDIEGARGEPTGAFPVRATLGGPGEGEEVARRQARSVGRRPREPQ